MLAVGAACESEEEHDSSQASCSSWCSVTEAYHHCRFCKCRACRFCRPKASITHVYASGGPQLVACNEGRGVEFPQGGLAIETDSNLQQCKAACDAVEECHSFAFSTAKRQCLLKDASGEPARFCRTPDFSTFWRVEVPHFAPELDANGEPVPPRRLEVVGRQLRDSSSGEEVVLHGVNIYLDYLRFDDLALIAEMLPGANMVRLGVEMICLVKSVWVLR